jgi:hypothetical protein
MLLPTGCALSLFWLHVMNNSQALEEGFEMVAPSGAVVSKAELLTRLAEEGCGGLDPGSKVSGSNRSSGSDPLSYVSSTAPGGGSSALGAALNGASTPGSVRGSGPFDGGAFDGGAFDGGVWRLWIEGLSQRRVAPGLWLLRYKELRQRFIVRCDGEDGIDADGARALPLPQPQPRAARACTALLREAEGCWWRWVSSHEAWVAR